MKDRFLTIIKTMVILIVGFFSLSTFAGNSYQKIIVGTVDLRLINFRLLSLETPFGFNMYTLSASNLSISPFDKNQVTMLVQIPKLQKFSTALLFRLRDASTGGCYLYIHGNSVSTTIETIGRYSKCYVSAVYHRKGQLLKMDMAME